MAYISSTRADRSTAILAAAVVHLGLAAIFMKNGDGASSPMTGQAVTKLIDIATPPPPPPPPPLEAARRPEREAGAAGLKAEPTPIVLPPPEVALPAANPLPAAPVAGNGSAATAGAASAGTGPGAGGTGDGRGAGGTGTGEVGGIGEDAHLVSGGLTRRDYKQLRRFAAPAGRAVLAILIGPDGRVAQCSTRQSSGDPALDATLCAMLQPRMQWTPARDRSGRTLTVGILYTAVWSRD